ncbi:MAG TPA: MraY family glycosyltransferase [Candidatus Acidoferrum sp.]|nr:MraY family glycosyltransferase [Candidatus Acidoferrum sp.]
MIALYSSVFLLCCLLSLLATRLVRDLARFHGWLEAPRLDRHVHTVPLPRIGGVAIFVSFAITIAMVISIPRWFGLPIVLSAKSIATLLGPAFIVFLLGLYDDLRGVGPYWKFLVEAGAAVLLFTGGYGINRFGLGSADHSIQSFIALPLTILWVLLITNAFNLIDGLDGLAAGSAFFSTIVVFMISLHSANPIMCCLSIALAGAILGFLRFNFNPATIFLGDSGSLFIGFMLSEMALVGAQKAPTMVAVAIPIVSLGLPILDVFLAVVRRFLGRKPLFKGDGDHVHHKLLKRGLSQREAVLLLYAVTAAFGFMSLVLLHQRSTIALVLGLTGLAVLVGVQQLRYGEFDEVLSLMQRATHRRQIVANHVAVRRATESLKHCNQFQMICRVLQATLEPVGFDGIRFQMMHPNGFAPSSFLPLAYEPDGKLVLTWSETGIDDPSWELRLELMTDSNNRWGYVSLLRNSGLKAIALDVNILSGEFCGALSRAVEQACNRLETTPPTQSGEPIPQFRKFAAGSTPR